MVAGSPSEGLASQVVTPLGDIDGLVAGIYKHGSSGIGIGPLGFCSYL